MRDVSGNRKLARRKNRTSFGVHKRILFKFNQLAHYLNCKRIRIKWGWLSGNKWQLSGIELFIDFLWNFSTLLTPEFSNPSYTGVSKPFLHPNFPILLTTEIPNPSYTSSCNATFPEYPRLPTKGFSSTSIRQKYSKTEVNIPEESMMTTWG